MRTTTRKEMYFETNKSTWKICSMGQLRSLDGKQRSTELGVICTTAAEWGMQSGQPHGLITIRRNQSRKIEIMEIEVHELYDYCTTYMYVCMYVCMHVGMYVCIHMFPCSHLHKDRRYRKRTCLFNIYLLFTDTMYCTQVANQMNTADCL